MALQNYSISFNGTWASPSQECQDNIVLKNEAGEVVAWDGDLTTVVSYDIDDSITSLGDGCFSMCAELTEITIPDSITTLSVGCFTGCTSLTSMVIPNSVTSIGLQCFRQCTSLTSVTIPESVTSIEDQCFYGCTSLASITIPNSVTIIAKNCFSGCEALTNITIPDSVTEFGIECFSLCTSLTSITIPDSVTSIGSSCFSQCTSLTSITIPDGVIEIDCFPSCTSLTDIIIPNSVTNIGNSCFRGCTSLTSMVIPNSVTSIGLQCFRSCTSLTNITIPESVTSIGPNCFENCTSLINITIPNSVTIIANDCFSECEALTNITIPESVTSIGDRSFNGCSSFTSITIPNSVTSIGITCFGDCTSLTSITIPDSVTDIWFECFNGCTSLTDIYVDPASSLEDMKLVMGVNNSDQVTLMKGLPEPVTYGPKYPILFSGSYSTTNTDYQFYDAEGQILVDCEYATQYSLRTGLTIMSDINDGIYPNYNFPPIARITIPAEVTEISNLTIAAPINDLIIPSNVKKISGSAFSTFSGESGVKNVELPGTLELFGDNPGGSARPFGVLRSSGSYDFPEDPEEGQSLFITVNPVSAIDNIKQVMVDSGNSGYIKYIVTPVVLQNFPIKFSESWTGVDPITNTELNDFKLKNASSEDVAWDGDLTTVTSYDVDETKTTIGDVFAEANPLTEFTNDNVTTLEANAFAGSSQLAVLSIGESKEIASIDATALPDNPDLDLTLGDTSTAVPAIEITDNKITIDGEEKVYHSVNGNEEPIVYPPRDKGTFQTSSNKEVKMQAAFDPRVTVNIKQELINKETWPYDGDTLYLYNGLLVSVVAEGSIYQLMDKDNALNPDYSAWKRMDGGAAITVDVIDNLESARTDAALSANQGKVLDEKILTLSQKLTSIYSFKGTKDTYAELLAVTDMEVGDVWDVLEAVPLDDKLIPAGSNWGWTGTEWDALGGSIDLSNYVTTEALEAHIPAEKVALIDTNAADIATNAADIVTERNERTAADTALSGRVDALETAGEGVSDRLDALETSVDTLNGDSTVEGSVDKKISDALSWIDVI